MEAGTILSPQCFLFLQLTIVYREIFIKVRDHEDIWVSLGVQVVIVVQILLVHEVPVDAFEASDFFVYYVHVFIMGLFH